MLSIGIALVPLAMVSLCAAAVPVLNGIRERHTRAAARRPSSVPSPEIAAVPSLDGSRLAVRLTNRSDGVYAVVLSASVYDQAGRECTRVDLPAQHLLPRRSLEECLELHSLPEGRYQAVVVAEFGGAFFAGRFAWTRVQQAVELTPAA